MFGRGATVARLPVKEMVIGSNPIARAKEINLRILESLQHTYEKGFQQSTSINGLPV